MTNHKEVKKVKKEVHVQQITSTLALCSGSVSWLIDADFYTAVLPSNHSSQIPPFKSIQQIKICFFRLYFEKISVWLNSLSIKLKHIISHNWPIYTGNVGAKRCPTCLVSGRARLSGFDLTLCKVAFKNV